MTACRLVALRPCLSDRFALLRCFLDSLMTKNAAVKIFLIDGNYPVINGSHFDVLVRNLPGEEVSLRTGNFPIIYDKLFIVAFTLLLFVPAPGYFLEWWHQG